MADRFYLVASPHHNTLVTYRFHPEFRAQRGEHGQGSNKTGRDGVELLLDVPPGTVAYEAGSGGLIPIADLTEPGQKVLVARGGRGGRGNAAFDLDQPGTSPVRARASRRRPVRSTCG